VEKFLDYEVEVGVLQIRNEGKGSSYDSESKILKLYSQS
jgi:hypothetical protein